MDKQNWINSATYFFQFYITTTKNITWVVGGGNLKAMCL